MLVVPRTTPSRSTMRLGGGSSAAGTVLVEESISGGVTAGGVVWVGAATAGGSVGAAATVGDSVTVAGVAGGSVTAGVAGADDDYPLFEQGFGA